MSYEAALAKKKNFVNGEMTIDKEKSDARVAIASGGKVGRANDPCLAVGIFQPWQATDSHKLLLNLNE